MQEYVYAADKPSDCKFCYFWRGTTGCTMSKHGCYYLIQEPDIKTECDGCPYGAHQPCIGWCTKKIMREVGIK